MNSDWVNKRAESREHLTCSSGLVQAVLLHDCSSAVLRLIPVPQRCVLWKQNTFEARVPAQSSQDKAKMALINESPSTACSSSCVRVSGIFFCCSGVTVPRANTTSTSALNCSYTNISTKGTHVSHIGGWNKITMCNEKHELTCRLDNSFIWLTGNQARYVSVVRHHRGAPTRMTMAAMDRAARWPRLCSERQTEDKRRKT